MGAVGFEISRRHIGGDILADFMTTLDDTRNKRWRTLQLAERLKWCRRVKGKTLREVEVESGVSNGYLSQLETGKIKDPGVYLMLKLARYYGVGLDELVAS